MAKVSIIITSYNQEALLREAIDSVLVQTVPPHEIIVADDHSTKDQSAETIARYARTHPQLKAILHGRNRGIPRNRNSALERVTGEYVAVLDGDDRLLPRFVEAHLAALRARPDTGVSYSNRYDVNACGERRLRFGSPLPQGDVLGYIARARRGILRSMLAKVDLVRAAGSFDEAHEYYDGFVLTLRLARMTRFVYVPEPLMEKRAHAGSVSKGLSFAEREKCFADLLAEVKQQTQHFPVRDQRDIEEIWRGKMLQQRVEAESRVNV
jgi:glycosyltransferase involved in cell wall biosynthesis